MSIVRVMTFSFAVLILVGIVSASPVEFCTGSTVNGYAGGNTWTTGGVQVSSAPGVPACKTVAYSSPAPASTVSGVGVVGGRTNNEIDFGESITVDFQSSVNLESFEIIVFYNGPEFTDPEEKGFVEVWFANAVGPTLYFFQADAQPSTTTLTDDIPGTYANISPMTSGNAGWFRFDNPFGDALVTRIRFTAADNFNGVNGSDYAVKSILYTQPEIERVPEPATYLLTGLGLLGLSLARRRSRV